MAETNTTKDTFQHVMRLAKLQSVPEKQILLENEFKELLTFAQTMADKMPEIKQAEICGESKALRNDVPKQLYSRNELIGGASGKTNEYICVPGTISEDKS